MKKVKHRYTTSNQETISREQTEIWITDDGRRRNINIRATTTGAEERTTQTTARKVLITTEHNIAVYFREGTTNSGCQGDMNLLTVLDRAREAWKKHRAETEEKHSRICDECLKPMREGYCIDGGSEYYCCDRCLHAHYTPEEREEMYDDGNSDSYRTEREEDDN
jgi:hypothetical protein